MDPYSYLSNSNISEVESLYKKFKENPDALELGWKKFFEGFEFARRSYNGSEGMVPEKVHKEFKVLGLIEGYRNRGHLFTKTNPVRERRKYFPSDDLETFGLSDEDLDLRFEAGKELGLGVATLREIVAHLKETYCQSVGAEFKYIRHPEVISWMQKKMESSKNTHNFSLTGKKHILNKLNHAVAFESFLHTKFPGQKRFSLEGAESLIPALDAVIEYGSDLGIKEFIIGMAHRGRLNVLANILNKTYEDIFYEFQSREHKKRNFDGDVKYHLGYTSDVLTANGNKVHLSVSANPSHLEAVDAVVQGMVRAKLDHFYKQNLDSIAPILIHGDAAIAGQGIVYEVIQMSRLKGFRTGGTIHLVINNQVGFTTNYIDARSSTYCTDVAKVTLSPVFHVNGDDVEALVYTIKFAMEYRQKFHRDVFIDILCYRKYGHNEGDEPRFTQPLLYKAIASHPNPREIYVQKLMSQGDIATNLVKEMQQEFKALLETDLDTAKKRTTPNKYEVMSGSWKKIREAVKSDFDKSPETGVSEKLLHEISTSITTLPDDKPFFNKTIKLIEERKKMMQGKGAIDWGMAEMLAYGSLLIEGHPVRISGQDVERGTFSHRHAVLRLEDSEKQYIPLQHINESQAPFWIYNSLLSEYGVLGFEYGYGSATPSCLTVWEAQFGDFFNGAQIIIDQYLSCAEDKWKRMNGIVLYLPHGYEGQGAEHSSARIERFLNSCAELNMQLVNCTTPANFFHVLRRQLHRPFRKPLIIFTPKSLLRHSLCISTIEDLSKGKFQEIIDDNLPVKDIKRLLLCSGKIYYDLLKAREEKEISNVAIVRLEQLYPLATKQLSALAEKYKHLKSWTWVQEEPENMGAWNYLLRVFKTVPLKGIYRHESASPATGNPSNHKFQQNEIMNQAFADI